MAIQPARLPGSREALRLRLCGAALIAILVLLAATAAWTQLLEPPEDPPGNPLTPAKANLGKVLFWDEQLSSTRTVSCGTCHFPSHGGDDPRLGLHPGPDGEFGTEDDIFGSPGVPLNHADGLYDLSPLFGLIEQVTGRRTGPTLNAAYVPELFWDGRAPDEFVDPVSNKVILSTGAALESQAVGPPVNDVEMAHVGRVWQDVLARIAESEPLAVAHTIPWELFDWIAGRSYPELFEEAFEGPEITAPRVAMAIASHQRTMFTDQAPFDVWQHTGQGLTPEELAGFDVFNGVGQCNNCHHVPLMTDHAFHFTGVRPREEDPGRMAVTGDPEDEGKMRTPSLRNLELRAPYMHNGRLLDIEEVIAFYEQGGDFPPSDIEPLELTAQQKSDLLAFLTRPLTDPRVPKGLPPFDRPKLFTESPLVPVIEGEGLPGSGGEIPLVVALEPPLVGNPSFTVGVWNALGGAMARLVIDAQDPGLTVPGPGDYFADEMIPQLEGSGPGGGYGSVSLEIPDDPALQGTEWFGRWYVEDSEGVAGVAVGELFRLRPANSLRQRIIFGDDFYTGDPSRWSSVSP